MWGAMNLIKLLPISINIRQTRALAYATGSLQNKSPGQELKPVGFNGTSGNGYPTGRACPGITINPPGETKPVQEIWLLIILSNSKQT